MAQPSRRLGTASILGLATAAALVPLNSTMIAVALPDVALDFDVASGSTGALVTVYLVVMLVGQPAMGRIGDVVGARRLLLAALVGFGTVSILTAMAGSFALVVLGRAGQAVFGAALVPSTQSLLRSLTEPENRGRSFGLLGSFLGAGAAAGPVVGGLMTELSGWRGIFLVNVPVVVAALSSTYRIPAVGPSVGATSERDRRGVLETLGQGVFVSSFLIQATSTLAQYSLLLVTPIALDARGWASGEVGLALTSLTAGMILLGPAGGRTGDRAGRRLPASLGIGVGVIGTAIAAATVESSPFGIVLAMTLFGLGLGFAAPSIQTAALEAVPEEHAGSASGVLSMSRYTGSIPASVLLAILVTDGGDGSSSLMMVASAAMLVALGLTTRLPGRRMATEEVGSSAR